MAQQLSQDRSLVGRSDPIVESMLKAKEFLDKIDVNDDSNVKHLPACSVTESDSQV